MFLNVLRNNRDSVKIFREDRLSRLHRWDSCILKRRTIVAQNSYCSVSKVKYRKSRLAGSRESGNETKGVVKHVVKVNDAFHVN